MKTIAIAIALLAFAATVPAADAHIGTTGGCTWYDIDIEPAHWHVCAGTAVVDIVTTTTLA